MFKAKFKGDFSERMRKRADQWAGTGQMAAAITVPPELSWWHVQEFGYEADHKTDYEIPGNPDIAFEGRTGTIIRHSVVHPGVKHPTHTVGKVFEEMNATIGKDMARIFSEGEYIPEEVKALLLTQYMEGIKKQIVEEMAQDLPGRRAPDPAHPKQSGKLEGKTAAEVFEEKATVSEVE